MSIWGPLTADEYEAVKRVIEQMDEAEAQFSAPFKEHPVEQIREIADMRAKMQAAVDGYEAAQRENT